MPTKIQFEEAAKRPMMRVTRDDGSLQMLAGVDAADRSFAAIYGPDGKLVSRATLIDGTPAIELFDDQERPRLFAVVADGQAVNISFLDQFGRPLMTHTSGFIDQPV